MKQLALPLLDWKFKRFTLGSVIERQYSNGKETLRLFWDGKRDHWRDMQNRKWVIPGPEWGQPLLIEGQS
jgi:hypothetical protein